LGVTEGIQRSKKTKRKKKREATILSSRPEADEWGAQKSKGSTPRKHARKGSQAKKMREESTTHVPGVAANHIAEAYGGRVEKSERKKQTTPTITRQLDQDRRDIAEGGHSGKKPGIRTMHNLKKKHFEEVWAGLNPPMKTEHGGCVWGG